MNDLNTLMSEKGEDVDTSTKLGSRKEIIEQVLAENGDESNHCLNGLNLSLTNDSNNKEFVNISNDNHKKEMELLTNLSLSLNINNNSSLGNEEASITSSDISSERFDSGFDRNSGSLPPSLVLSSEIMVSPSSDDSVSDISTESESSGLKNPCDTEKNVSSEISLSNSFLQLDQQNEEITKLQDIIDK